MTPKEKAKIVFDILELEYPHLSKNEIKKFVLILLEYKANESVLIEINNL